MEISILGCSGGKTPKHRLTSFLIDGSLLLDAGSVSEVLSIQGQLGISAVLVTHAHLDHICGLVHIYQNTRDARSQALDIYAPEEVIQIINTHLFVQNEVPANHSQGLPGINFHPIVPGQRFLVESYEIEAVKVNHPAGGVGYFISDGETTFANTGDTGPTEDFWQRYRERGDVDILITEISFPNNMQQLADVSCHLSPQGLAAELKKAGIKKQPVHLSHLKPAYQSVLEKEVNEIKKLNLLLLKDGDKLKHRKKTKTSNSLKQIEIEAMVADKIPVFDYAKDLYVQREEMTREFGVNFSPGEIIFEQGEHSKVMYIIQQGKVRILRTIQGVERTLGVLGTGEFFGEMAMLNNRPRSAAAECVNEVRALAFEKQAFEKLVTENYGIAIKLIRTLAQRIQDADVMIENLMYVDPASKLVNTLIRAAINEGMQTKQGYLLRLTPEDLALRTGVRVAALRKALTELVQQKLVIVKKDSINIPDLGKLHRYLEFLELREEFPA